MEWPNRTHEWTNIPMFVFYHLLLSIGGRVDRIEAKASGLKCVQAHDAPGADIMP